MARYLKVKDHENLVKDPTSKAILNVDPTVLLKHEQKMKQLEKEKRREDEINNIKSELSEIKSLLQKLLNG